MARVTFVQKQLSLWGAGTGGPPLLLFFTCEARVVPSLLSELYPAGGKIDLELLDLFG